MRVTDDPTTLVRVDAAAASGGDTVFASPGVFQFWPLARDGRYPVVHSAGSDATMWRISLVTEEDLDELATEVGIVFVDPATEDIYENMRAQAPERWDTFIEEVNPSSSGWGPQWDALPESLEQTKLAWPLPQVPMVVLTADPGL